MCGLSMCRELLAVIKGIGAGIAEQEEEIRQKIRRLAEL